MLASIPLWLFLILGVLIAGLVVCSLYLKKLSKKLETFMHGKDAASLEATLSWLTEKYSDLDGNIKVHKEALEHIDRRVKRSTQAQSLIRYDAFEDAGGAQSFATALLNEHGDGYILSLIAHRTTNHIYAKKVTGFTAESALTDEEEASLLAAKKSL